jgi:hypothetical protein
MTLTLITMNNHIWFLLFLLNSHSKRNKYVGFIKNGVPRNLLAPKRGEMTGAWRKLLMRRFLLCVYH